MQVEIYADIICPRSYFAVRRFARALAELGPDRDLVVVVDPAEGWTA
jgi:predicted DsbA family dithiol-disulfide isomerase